MLTKTVTLTGANTGGSASNVSSGATLQLGDGVTAGTYAGNIVNSGTVAFNAPAGGLSYGGSNSVIDQRGWRCHSLRRRHDVDEHEHLHGHDDD